MYRSMPARDKSIARRLPLYPPSQRRVPVFQLLIVSLVELSVQYSYVEKSGCGELVAFGTENWDKDQSEAKW